MLLVAALGVAGLISAKGKIHNEVKKNCGNAFVKNNIHEQKTSKKFILIYKWIRVISPCGAVYYLDLNDYSNQFELMSDVVYFNGQKCNGDTGLNPIV